MSTILDKIAEIEAEMARTQKNKATAGHLGMLKAKLAKLRRELITPKSQGGGTQEGRALMTNMDVSQSLVNRLMTSICLFVPSGFEVAKTGDARIGFIGFPSVGKSTLLSNLAGVYSEVAAYEFTVNIKKIIFFKENYVCFS
jgi:ribosome-interacting GTPase 1